MGIHITQDEPDTGGPNRTERKKIAPLVTGRRQVNPEAYVDVSPSLSWAWRRNPAVNTWSILVPSLKGFTEPFALLDSQAADELSAAINAGGADEAGGVELWPFSDTYLRLSAKKDADGDPIIDANPGNFDERWAEFVQLHRDHFDAHGMPEYGGTEVMLAIAAGDAHFIGNPKDPQDKGEFGERPAAERPFRLRSLWTDGALEDKAGFIAYLSQATPVIDPTVSETTTIGLARRVGRGLARRDLR